MRKSLRNGYFQPLCAVIAVFLVAGPLTVTAETADAAGTFEPSKGFKPAQRDLGKISLQLAGSLEYFGSPEPYLRFVADEDAKAEKIYADATGKQTAIRPSFLSDAYLNQFSKNWNHLAPKLQLESLAKKIGANLREDLSAGSRTPTKTLIAQRQQAILHRLMGDRVTGTGVDDSIAQLTLESNAPFHSARESLDKISAALDRGLSKDDADHIKTFISDTILNTGLAAESEFEAAYVAWAFDPNKDKNRYDVSQETRLSPEEVKKFSALLVPDHFTKADFPLLDAFYSSTAYDRLSEAGKDQLSKRVWSGVRVGTR